MKLQRKNSRQGGQAITEFLVASLVLVPLFVLIPMIGKYQDLAHSTAMASRYVAFDAMVRNDRVNSWKPEAQLAQEVRRRFFSNSSAAIKSDDSAGDFTANRNPLWTDPAGGPLIQQFDRDITVSFGSDRKPRHTDAFTGAHDATPFPGHGWFGLSRRGIYSGNVTVAVANLPAGIRAFEPFDALDLKITRTAAVLIDPWSGRSADDVQGRLDNVLVNPGGLLANLKPVTDLAVAALDGQLLTLSNIKGPQLGRLQFWSDVVQPDRLR